MCLGGADAVVVRRAGKSTVPQCVSAGYLLRGVDAQHVASPVASGLELKLCISRTAYTAPMNTMNTAAQHWDAWQKQRKPGRYTDWGDHPYALSQIFENAFGDANCGLIEYLQRCLPDLSQAHVLSLCCGDGAFEHSLVQQGIFGRVTGFDISKARVDAGNQNFQGQYGVEAEKK